MVNLFFIPKNQGRADFFIRRIKSELYFRGPKQNSIKLIGQSD